MGLRGRGFRWRLFGVSIYLGLCCWVGGGADLGQWILII